MSFRPALRRLAKSPLFTLLTVLTLALGIGANSAIFSVINGILLKPLAYPHPETLIALDHQALGISFRRAGMAPFLYFTYKEQARAIEHAGMWSDRSVTVTGFDQPQQVDAEIATHEVLEALDVPPLLGRWFSAQDDSPGSAQTIVLMYPYWQSRFGGDRSVIGRRVLIDGVAREVIGVMPENFRFLDRKPALLEPFRFDRAKISLGNFGDYGVARLKHGVTLAQANADAARLMPVALRAFPPFPGMSLSAFEQARLTPRLAPLKDDVVGDIGKTLWVLMATIGMVLLIACANVANLLLVRAEGRRHELAIRAALGAGRARIARELLIESMMLAALGGIAGLGVAFGAVRVLVAMAPANLPRLDQISIDAPVLWFTLLISAIAGLLFGAIPAIRCAAPGLELRAGGRSVSASRERHRARSVLAIVQVALALLLLIGSGLMMRTFEALHRVQPGFSNAREVETLRLRIPETQVPDATTTARMEQAMVEKIAQIPGVSAVGLASTIPMTGDGWTDPIDAQDHNYGGGKLPPMRRFKMVSPGLLTAMGNTLVAGRDFEWQDLIGERNVVMISENVARELWGGARQAIGKQVRRLGGQSAWREVVGVVGDERDDGVNQNAPKMIYWPLRMKDFGGDPDYVQRVLAIVVRSPRAATSGFLDDVQRAVWSVNPNLLLAQIQTLETIYDKSLQRTSFTLVLLAIAGAMAMLIGLVGIYGVISYSVSQRTREIGIRVALGAQKQEVTGLFLAHGLLLAGLGTAFGLAAAVALTRAMSSLLFEVSPIDPATYALVSLALIAAAALASAIPAWRATSVDPVEALRAE